MNIIKQATYGKNEYKVQNRELLFRGFLQVEKVSLTHQLFSKTSYTPVIHRELIHRPEAAGVLLYDDEQQKFALIEQFRIGAMDDKYSPWQLEIIAGVLDGDESPESCVRRESLEESGCEVDDLEHLFTFYPSAGACSELFHLYSAKVTLPKESGVFGMPTEGENILLHLFSYQNLTTLLTNGRLRNAPVIMALQWLKQHIKTIEDV